MTTTTELTYAEVATHNTKKDLYVVIHDKVYDVRKFVDEHPYVYSVYPLSPTSSTKPELHVAPCTRAHYRSSCKKDTVSVPYNATPPGVLSFLPSQLKNQIRPTKRVACTNARAMIVAVTKSS
jgi:Cytochrome b5-like Heme/Steroid binding domain